jgi:hypothetical protein
MHPYLDVASVYGCFILLYFPANANRLPQRRLRWLVYGRPHTAPTMGWDVGYLHVAGLVEDWARPTVARRDLRKRRSSRVPGGDAVVVAQTWRHGNVPCWLWHFTVSLCPRCTEYVRSGLVSCPRQTRTRKHTQTRRQPTRSRSSAKSNRVHQSEPGRSNEAIRPALEKDKRP